MSIVQMKSGSRGRVTINDLARELGLAKGTVSRALNGYPDISDATRLRVSRAAERMGYRPMAQAQAIRTGLSRALGLVLNAGPGNAHKPFLTDFLDGISRAASEAAWTLTVATAFDEADEVATMARLVDERKVDGFILPRTKIVDARIDLHGLVQGEAHSLLYGFLHRAHAEGCRMVLVITGKGSSLGSEGVLRRAIPGWLQTPQFRHLVAGFDEATRVHGGEGALYVRLRGQRP